MDERVLIVEDDAVIRMALTDRLESEGYQLDYAADGDEGFRKATGDAFHLIILDVMLPRRNGIDVCRDVRMAGVMVPILMLTARGQTVDKVLGLKIGADDYLTKPFDSMELLARMEALLRRARIATTGGTLEFGSLKIDLRGTSVERNGEAVPLSAREFQLLRYFIEHRGVTLSRGLLLKEVWGYSTEAFSRTVDVHVASLRQKIEETPKHPKLILTVPGLGYKFGS
ncbi:MAG: response regulator transcription factor [Acidobacteria bacterium]|nr:response regulator transcription factor [Acidobacteriota bacterium]